jgi:hypothetical protein
MTRETGRPEPLTPPDCDLRGMDFFPLDTMRLLDSELWLKASADEFKAAVGLWCMAWRQLPAGSIPDDDAILSRWAVGWGLNWAKVRTGALHGFVKCTDGRLYHPVLCVKALEAWAARQKHKVRQAEDAERKRIAREEKARRRAAEKAAASVDASADNPGTSADASEGCPADIPGTSAGNPQRVRSRTGTGTESLSLSGQGLDSDLNGGAVKNPLHGGFSQHPPESRFTTSRPPLAENIVALRPAPAGEGPIGGAA